MFSWWNLCSIWHLTILLLITDSYCFMNLCSHFCIIVLKSYGFISISYSDLMIQNSFVSSANRYELLMVESQSLFINIQKVSSMQTSLGIAIEYLVHKWLAYMLKFLDSFFEISYAIIILVQLCVCLEHTHH